MQRAARILPGQHDLVANAPNASDLARSTPTNRLGRYAASLRPLRGRSPTVLVIEQELAVVSA